MSIQESIKIVPQGDIAVVEFDLYGEKVNKLSTPVMLRLKEVIQELARSSYKAVIFKSNKNKIFIAGADIEEIKSMTTKEQFSSAIQSGQEIMNMIEDLPIPSFAAVNGACMGGGCEFIMACDYRIASDDSSTKIGLPETQLGIIPGFGGCVRMPRMLGLANAFDIILAGKAVNAKKAQKIGLVDKVVHPNILMEQAVKWAKEVIAQGGKKRSKTFEPKGLMSNVLESVGKGIVYSKAREGVMKMTHGHYPAPLKAIEVIKKSYGKDRQIAMEIEREGFIELGITDVSKNLIHVFYLTEMVKKQTGVTGSIAKAKPVKNIGVLGAGTMGGGIAYIAADKGIDVRMKDLNADALGKGLKHASDLWRKLVKRKSIDQYQYQQKMSLISTTTDYSGFKNMDVVIEAIVEDMGIKQKVIGETAGQMRPDAIIATNTSSLSVSECLKVTHALSILQGCISSIPSTRCPWSK
jgi:3-hydroxyacyl-CoA dehydrogenase/enoyl-CoA hydratase/3-hydroxybutyryl-CoA epimerase